MKPTARILSALLAAAMLLPSQALAAETAPEAAAAAVTAEAPQSEFAVTFAAEHAGVDVYYTHDYTKADEENVSAAFAQNSDTGEIDTTGDGQVNFLLRPDVAKEVAETIGYPTPNLAARKLLSPEVANDKSLYPDAETISKGEWQNDVGDASRLYEEYYQKLKAGR